MSILPSVKLIYFNCHVKFGNNTSGRVRLWDTALKFLATPFNYVTRSPGVCQLDTDECRNEENPVTFEL